jgi:UDPglucose 6-dehydrogenase
MGKLGLPVALAIESRGFEVVGYDVRQEPYDYIESRQIPFKEEGLQPLLDRTNVSMVRTLGELVAKSDILFLPVQTPHGPEYEGSTRLPDERADFDYSFLKEAVTNIATISKELGKVTTLATISTCLPGTYEREIKPLLNENIEYVYTPQFIAMGTVLNDYLYPEFNLVGVESVSAADQLGLFYAKLNDAPTLQTDITTAEGIKVSYNTWITAKTVIANAWGEMAHKTGMNFDDILKAWKLADRRLISPRYMDSGVGDGGGCHPRDNIALSHIAEQVGMSHNIWEDLMESREAHMEWLADVVLHEAETWNLPVIVLGRSFKPETNIETGSPSILMVNILKERGLFPQHHEDLEGLLQKAIYVIGTNHARYKEYKIPKGSIVVDPFRQQPDRNGVETIRIGGTIKHIND